MSEFPPMETPVSRRSVLIAAGSVLGLAACSEPSLQEQFPPVPDCAEANVSVESLPLSAEPLKLTELDWEVPGAERQGKTLKVSPIDMAVYHKDSDTYQQIPLFNTAYRFDGEGDVRLRASVATQDQGRFSLLLSEGLPLIYDDFVLPRRGVRVTCGSNEEVLIETWDGQNQQPRAETFKVPAASGRTITIDRTKTGTGTNLNIDGKTMSLTGFQGSQLWLGVGAQDAPAEITSFSIQSVGGSAGSVEMKDMRTLKVAECGHGLRQTAARRRPDFRLGTATSLSPLLCDGRYAALLPNEFNMITPENALKPQFTQPEEGIFTLQDARQQLAFARRHNMAVHGHALIPNRSFPRWMAELPTDTPAEQRRVEAVMVAHIKGVMTKLPEILSWDVFSEPLDGRGWQDTPFFRAMGERMFEVGMRAAHEANPKAELWINENAMDKEGGYDEERFYKILGILLDLRDKGIPVTGMGFEGHAYNNPDDLMSPVDLRRRVQILAHYGLRARVSEMDVVTYKGKNKGTTDDGLRTQALQFREVAKVCIEEPNCDFASWGIGGPYVSTASIKNGKLDYDSHLVWDNHMRPRPAYAALHQAFR